MFAHALCMLTVHMIPTLILQGRLVVLRGQSMLHTVNFERALHGKQNYPTIKLRGSAAPLQRHLHVRMCSMTNVRAR